MTPERILIDCPRCHGTGGPAPIFDEDLARWVTYVCPECSGSGERRIWTDEQRRVCPITVVQFRDRIAKRLTQAGMALDDEHGDRQHILEQLVADLWCIVGDLTGANLSGADLIRADLTGADLTGADLTRADLRDAVLRGVNLSRADLTGADLTYAILTDAVLYGTDLTGADLTGANLYGANLTGAVMYDADLYDAEANTATVWPAGFDPDDAGVRSS